MAYAIRPAFWIAFKHGGERNIEDLANVKETGRTDPVATPFIFLNLLEADAQCPAKFVLAHVEGKPSFAHSSLSRAQRQRSLLLRCNIQGKTAIAGSKNAQSLMDRRPSAGMNA